MSVLSGRRYNFIKETLTNLLNPIILNVTDESHLHAGHRGGEVSGKGETHFSIEVVSEKFEGQPLIQRHRMINDSLKNEFETGLHALSLKTKTPKEYEKAKQQQKQQ